MPSNDFDKILRDKVAGYEAPYNPADWGQMEAMLDQEGSRKPLLLILLIFLLGLLGSSVFLFNSFDDSGRIVQNHVGLMRAGDNSLVPFRNDCNDPVVRENSTVVQDERPGFNESGGDGKNDNGNYFASSGSNPNSSNVKSEDPKKDVANSHKTGLAAANPSDKNGNDNIGSFKIDREEEEQLFVSTFDGLPLEVHNLNSFEEIPLDKTLESEKRKVVSFALGFGGGFNQSFLKSESLTKPGYQAGLTEELMFIDRIGLSFGQGYSQRTYKVSDVHCNYFSADQCPLSYQSTIKAFEIVIDVKANLVHKEKWDYYVKAGFQHNFKISETFDYQYPSIDTVLNPPNLPSQNNFNSTASASTEFDLSGGLNTKSYIEDFTISQNKRYHGAFHFATGFDYRIRNRFALQYELGYYGSLPKIGAQEKHLQAIGFDTRFLYRFGK